jgi:hypothetical protein
LEELEGVGPKKDDETVSAMIAQLKYGSGVPFHRLERMQELLGIPMPAATPGKWRRKRPNRSNRRMKN